MVLDSLARIIKLQLPAYLKRLPLPESVGGFLRLTVSIPMLDEIALSVREGSLVFVFAYKWTEQ